MRMPARRRHKRRAAAPGLPGGRRPASAPRASSFRHSPAAPSRKGLPVITRHIYESALRPSAISAGRLFQSGNTRAGLRYDPITARRKMAGTCAAASGRAAGRGGTTPGRDGPERLAGGTWRRAGPQRPGAQRRRARGQPGRGPDGKARPWPRPRTGLDRRLAARNWPRFLRGAGTALAVSLQPAGRIPPAWLLIPIRSVRHQFPLTVPERRLGDRKRFPAGAAVGRKPGARLLVGWPPGRHHS